MPRLVHFEIPADDPKRAVKFYKEVFGWEAMKWEGMEEYYLVTTGKDEPGIDGSIKKREQPFLGVHNTVDVSDVDEFIEKITKNGGKIIQPKMTVPGVGYLAYFQDTEGNLTGIMHSDPSAAVPTETKKPATKKKENSTKKAKGKKKPKVRRRKTK